MISYRNTFSKEERLCSRTILQDLFSRRSTKSFSKYPLLAIWSFQLLPSPSPVQVAFSVPKKKFRKAHDRNRIKRQLREIFRLNKNNFYQAVYMQRLQCAVVIVYIADQKLPYERIEHAYNAILQQIVASIQPDTGAAPDRPGEVL